MPATSPTHRLRTATAFAALAALAVLVPLGSARADEPNLTGPYLGAPFQATHAPHDFGQAPSFAANGNILSGELDSAGIRQVYRADDLTGANQHCLTCSTVPGPSGFAQDRPSGDWILFESYGAQPSAHTGNPGFGGYGGDLYAMHEDGSHAYRLTAASDPNGGKPFTQTSGTPYDNFHAYWSPDGQHVIWTHTEANAISKGGETWSILLGDFTVTAGVPAITNVRVVGPPFGAYETQPWTPDGSGFLFSAAGGNKSPFTTSEPGWTHMDLYYMRLFGAGASPAHPMVTKLTSDLPAYTEQALMTPDMKTWIAMTNLSHPQGSWYNLITTAAQRTSFDTTTTGSANTISFLADFSGTQLSPAKGGSGFISDLYVGDVATGAIRQLTDHDAVIPEFYWSPDYSRIIWSEANTTTQTWTTWTGQFPGLSAATRVPSTTIPAAGLYGTAIDMTRIGKQAQAIRDPGPTANTPVAVVAPASPAAAFPHAAVSKDKSTIPSVTLTYVVAWEGDLISLQNQSDKSFLYPPVGLSTIFAGHIG